MAHDPQRPDPDELLARVQAEEERQARGKLKVFLGYAAGVGKTYAMLEAAISASAKGLMSQRATWRRMDAPKLICCYKTWK